MKLRASSIQRFSPFIIIFFSFFLLIAFCASSFARDPHPRRMRNRGDLTQGGWVIEVPGTYGSLYGIRLKDELKRDGVSPSIISRYCPTPEEAQAQGTIPWKCDCFFEPFGPIEEWVKITRTVTPEVAEKYGDQCYAPPYTTSGKWWDWLVSRFVANKQARMSIFDQISYADVYLGIDGECRPLKSDDGWKRLDNGSDMRAEFYNNFVPAVVKKIKELYPGKLIRIHTDPQMKNYFLENLIDFHRESLEADERQAFCYQGLQFTQMGWWQGFSEHYWVTNSLGLAQDWWNYYLSVLSGLSKHTDMITGGCDPAKWGEDFCQLYKDCIGRDIRDVPRVWIHLRETMRTKEVGGNFSGKYGDYDFYLYRTENLGGNQTVPVKASTIAAINPAVKNQIFQKDLPTASGSADRYIGRKVAPGSRYMSFDIDDGYTQRFSGQSGVSFDFRIVYFDEGSDTFKLQYKDGNNQWREKSIVKTNTRLWKEAIINVTDGVFNNGASEGLPNAEIYPTDFRLDFGDPAIPTVIHFVEVRARGGMAKDENRPRAQVSVDLVRDKNDDPRKGYYSVGLNQRIWVKATLKDSEGRPIPNERIIFTYNTEWNMAKSAYTDSNGVAFMDFSTANRLDSSGFVGGGGTSYRATWYMMTAYFPGSDRYRPSRNDAKLFVTDSPSESDPRNLRMEIVSISPIYGDGKVDVKVQLYSSKGPVGSVQIKTIGRSDGFYADDPNAQTIGFPPPVHPDGYFMTSNNVTLYGNTNGTPSKVENVQAVNGPNGDQITLTWKPNPEPDIAGYRIFYGTESGRYTKFYGVGKTNRATISGLEPGKTYYFIVEATNLNAYAGDWSKEVSATVGNASILLTVNKTGTGSGTVTGMGINCGDDCIEAFGSSGASVTLTAAPASGSTFVGWSGDCSGTGACTVTMNSSKNVTAVFNASAPPSGSTYTITASAGAGGSISPAGTLTVNSGANQTFIISPQSGYRIADVKVDGISQGAISSYTFNQVTTNHTIAATFSATGGSGQTYTITASAGGGGSISPSGAVTVNNGANKTFTITPNDGYRISDVLIDGASQGALPSYTFNSVSSNHTIHATFTPGVPGTQRTFAVNCGGGQYTDKSGIVYQADSNFSGGSTYTTTEPIDGSEDDLLYQSERWGNFSYNIPLANGSYYVVLKFAEIYNGIVRTGQRVFGVWVEGREVISNLDLFAQVGIYKTYDVTIPVSINDGALNIEFRSSGGNAKVNAILVASVAPASQYTITASASGGGTVSPNGAVSVARGASQTFTITPSAGYSIEDVRVDGVSQGARSSYTFSNVVSDHTIAVSFKPMGRGQYSLNINHGGTGTGVVTADPSGPTYAGGTIVKLTAEAEAGSTFAGWSGDCTGRSPVCNITMSQNRVVTAFFNRTEAPISSFNVGQKGVVVDLDGDGQNDLIYFDEKTGHVYAWYLSGPRVKDVQFVRNVAEPNWRMVGGGNFRAGGQYQIFWHNQQTGAVYAWLMSRENYVQEQFIRIVEDTQWKLGGVGDLNGDGHVDLIWHHQRNGDVYVWFMNGTNVLYDQYIRSVEDLRWQIVGLGDFNADGKAEILWQHQATGALYIWFLNGATYLGDQYIQSVEDLNWKIIGVGPFPGNRFPGIFWRHSLNEAVYVWHMSGATFLRDERIQFPAHKGSVDFNGDGKGDLLFHNPMTGVVSLWVMDGINWVGEQEVQRVEDLRWKIVGAGGFTGEGRKEVLWHHHGTGDLYVWFTEGGKFLGDQKIANVPDTNWRPVGVGDFNKDGRIDILWQHQVTGDVFVWYMDGLKFIRDEFVARVSDTGWKIVAVADLNGDGHPDLLWKHEKSGETYVWHMNGKRFIHEQRVRPLENPQWQVEGVLKSGSSDQAEIIWRSPNSGQIIGWQLEGTRYVKEKSIRTLPLPR